MLCRRMRLTERHLQPPREPLAGPIVRPCTARKLMNLDTATSNTISNANTTTTTTGSNNVGSSSAHTIITIPTGDEAGTHCEGQPFSPRGRKPTEGPKTPLMIVNLNIPPGTETLAPKSASRSERHKLPHFCMQYRNFGRYCSAPPGCTSGHGSAVPTGVIGTSGSPGSGLIPQIFIQSFELQDRRAADGPAGAAEHDQQQGSQQYNIITENDEDTFATLLLDNISNISLEMIQRHQQKLLGTTASSITESPHVTGATGGSATCFQHVEGCSSMERTESKTSTDVLLPLDGRMDSHEERDRQPSRGQSASGPSADRLAVTQESMDDQNPDIPAGYRSLCYRTPSPKTRQIIRVDIVTSREKY